jgi:PAS domain S-box-containing protein
MAISILALSILLQIAAAVTALRLVRTTGWHLAWLLIAGALVLMAVRRSNSLYNLVVEHAANDGLGTRPQDLTIELVALAISAILLLGIALIGPIFVARQRSEEALREREAYYRGILDNSTDTFYRTDTEGRIVLASRSATDLLGYSVEELMGRRLSSLYADPGGREVFLKALEASGGRIRGYETPLRHKSGSVVVAATSASYVRDGNGNVIGVEGTARDITDQKRTEQLSTRFGRIVEDSVNEVYVFDSETLRFLIVNRGARENLGYSMDELRELTPADIKPHFDAGQFADLVAPLRDGTNELVDFETVHLRKDGSTYDVDVRLHLARTEDPPVFFAIIQDVTDRRRTEEALRQSQKMEAVGQLTGGIAHDFNNLLAVIVGNLDLARENLDGDSKLAADIDRALAAATRGADLTGRLLAISRRQALHPKVVNLGGTVSEMNEILHRTLGETIQIQTAVKAELWNCEIDPGQMENVLLNLAINARDAMPAGGKLSIVASNIELDEDAALEADVAPGEYVHLGVTDSGAGMSAATRVRAFEPFFTTKDVGDGTGLGLSMVHGFVKQSGGYVKICSAEGQGTTIGIFLPRSKNAIEEIVVADRRTEPCGHGKSILVVEDDENVRELVVTMLDGFGYRAVDAGSGREALELFDSNDSIDALITDIVLPGNMSGSDVAEQCRRRNTDLKVLFISGYPQDKIVHHGRVDADVELLQKPFTRQALAEKLRMFAD